MNATIRLSGRKGLLSAIPAILGFHPANSLVIACLQGDTNKVGPILRVDLSEYRSGPAALAYQLGSIIAKHSDNAVLVFYGIDADPIGFAGMLSHHGVSILDTVFVGNEPHEINLRMHAENIGLGNVVHTTREGLRARVEFDENAEPHLDLELIAAMRDYTSRDAFLADNVTDARPALERVLATCRRIADDAVLADLCAVAAFLAYRVGDGALAQVCLDRALRIDPHHRLSQLMMQVMSVAILPTELDHLMEGVI